MPFPLSQPPKKPSTWWGTIPGQLAILTAVAAVFLILFEAIGLVNFHP